MGLPSDDLSKDMEERQTVDIQGENLGSKEDFIIPPKYSWPLMGSACLFLATSILSLVYSIQYEWPPFYPVVCLSFILFVTSVLHWYRPRFSSIIRKVDIFAVFSNVAYASYFSTILGAKYEGIWFGGLGAVIFFFISNEYAYFLQTGVLIDGASSTSVTINIDMENAMEDPQNSKCLKKTSPNTPERDFVYIRTMVVHLLGVHFLAAALAITLVVGASQQLQQAM